MTLGDLVKEYREKHNISMKDFSETCNLSKGYISMLENNTNPRNNKPIAPTLPTIKKISLAMNMDMDSVLRMLDLNQEIDLDYESDVLDDDFQSPNFSQSELEYIKKYRFISQYSINGTKMVDAVLDKEYMMAENRKNLETEIKELKSRLDSEKVHMPEMPNDIEKYEAAKKAKELTEHSKHVNKDTDYVNAAHSIAGASEEDKQFDEDIMNDEYF